MINLRGIEGFEYTKFSTYAGLVEWMQQSAIFSDSRVKWHDLGASSDPTKNVYGISIGDTAKKPVIYMQHQIHGRHEWRCSHWGFKWIEKLLNHDLGNPHETKKLLANFSFFIIPCLNPYGYENTTYGNANNVNLNRNYDLFWDDNEDTGYGTTRGTMPFSEPEAIISRNLVQSLKPYLFIDTHTRGENSIGSMYLSPAKFNHPMQQEVASSYRLSTSEGIAQSPSSDKPMAFAWASKQPNAEGREPMAYMLETPDLATEYNQAKYGFYLLTLTALYAMKYRENGMLRQYN